MKRVFITGEHGMIACAATHYLLKSRSFDLVNWAYDGDNSKTFSASYKNKNLKELDIRSENFVKKVLETRPHIIIHTAAYVNTDSCELDPKECVESNVYGTWQVIEAANKIGARIIFIGTTATYDPSIYDGTWIQEETVQRPKTIYGITKFASEELVINYAKEYTILSPCFAFGGILDSQLKTVNPELYYLRDTSSNITKIIYNSFHNILEEPRFTLKKSYLKDYMSVDDIGNCILSLCCNSFTSKKFNISLMKPNSWEMYLYMIKNELEKMGKEICKIKLLEEKDYLKNHLVNSRFLRDTIGWEPKFVVERVIKDVINKVSKRMFVFNERSLDSHKRKDFEDFH